MSKQLNRLAQRACQLEQACQQTAFQATDLPDNIITQLQSFDYLHQSLTDLTKLTALLAKSTEGDVWDDDTVQGIVTQLLMADTKAILDPNHRISPSADVDHPGDTLIF